MFKTSLAALIMGATARSCTAVIAQDRRDEVPVFRNGPELNRVIAFVSHDRVGDW